MNEEWCPGIMKEAYPAALEDAWQALASKDLGVQARMAGGTVEDGRIVLSTFGRRCIVDPVGRRITLDGKGVKQLGAILVLHYLINASQVQLSGHGISYRQLPGGNVYYPAFKARVIDVLGGMFHHDPSLLFASVTMMGAKKKEFGDASVIIPVFPKLPVTVIVWKGDTVVHGSANLLFDDTASRFLHTEDLAAVGTFVVAQLIKARTSLMGDINTVNTV
jgi:hypothetical protein